MDFRMSNVPGMAEVCLFCLSTQTDNLIDMTATEWTLFDTLLHPISEQYSSIKSNNLMKICLRCQQSMHNFEKFRKYTLKNFLFLMNAWRVKKSVNAIRDSQNCLERCNSLIVEPVSANSQPLPCTPPANNHGSMPTISSISTVYSHKKNYYPPLPVYTLEVKSENEDDGSTYIFNSEIGKIEPDEMEINIADPLKVESTIVDTEKKTNIGNNITEGTTTVCDTTKEKDKITDNTNTVNNITPVSYSRPQAFHNTIQNKGRTNSVASTERQVLHKTNIVDKVIEEQKQSSAAYTGNASKNKLIIKPAMLNDMNTLLKTMLQMSPNPPKKMLYPPKEIQYPPKEMQFPPKDMQCPPKEKQYPPKNMQYPPKEMQNPPKEMQYPPREMQYPPKEMQYTSKELVSPPKEAMISPKETQNLPEDTTIFSKEKPKQSYSCQKCNKVVTSEKDLHVHEYRVHREMPSNCTQCGRTQKNEFTLQVHIRTVHEKKKYCEICDIYFPSPSSYGYNNHLKWSPKHNDPDKLKAARVTCEICSKAIKNKDLLKQHMKTIHTTAKYCQPCDKWFRPSNYKVHLKTTPIHVSNEDNKYTCDYCKKQFGIKLKLRDHILVEHMKINPYKCKLCGAGFKTRSPLSNHVRVVHEKRQRQNKHVCDVCGKACPSSSWLRDHTTMHTGARPHACGKCNATFALFTHNKLKHDKLKHNKLKHDKLKHNKLKHEKTCQQ